MPVDEKDRHVLALAVDLEANLIVTSNLRDFPTDACQPDGVEAMTPDQLLTAIAASDPLAVRDELGEITARRTRPAMTPGELLDRLAGRLPEFAARTGAVAGSSRLTVRKRAGSSVRENFRGGLIGGLARRTSADRGAPARKKSLLDGHARTPVNGLEGVHTVEVRRSRRLSPTARDGLIGRGEWPGRWRSMVPADDVVGRDPEPVLDAVGQAAPVEAGAFQVSFTCREPTPVAGATPLAPHAPRARQHLNTSVARGRRPLAGSDARHQGFV
jgi:hypothetical protein